MDNTILNFYSKIPILNVSRETCFDFENLISMIREKNNQINITDSAVKKILSLTANEDDGVKLRLSVSGGGCSGFQYVFKSEDSINENKDIVFNFKNIQILIDKNSMDFINESELDYKDELIGSSFSITNPNAKNSCGCGTSFSV